MADRSSLVIGFSPTAGGVPTLIGGGPPVPPFIGLGSSITHNNQVVGGPTLLLATQQATLGLTAQTPGPPGAPFVLPPLNFNIAFRETPNSAPCAVVTSPVPCNDIFVLVGGLLNQSFMSLDAGGPDAPVTYFVNIFPTTGGVLSQLPTDVCDGPPANQPAASASPRRRTRARRCGSVSRSRRSPCRWYPSPARLR